MQNQKEIKVVELFAGVGGFRVGLEKSSSKFSTVWANQWEPGKKIQHAFNCYTKHFGESDNHVCQDISTAKALIPPHDLLVGGFPCQDYSVARTGAKGIEGKKGVLWWDINDILITHTPKYVLLENVDRLIKSPSTQRGRDFGVILRCLLDLGYAVEWRIINAANYGQAQRRRRVFIFAYHESTTFYKTTSSFINNNQKLSHADLLLDKGFFASPFPVHKSKITNKIEISNINKNYYNDLAVLSQNFNANFYNSGIMFNGYIYSQELIPRSFKPKTLEKIRTKEPVDEKYFIIDNLEKFKYLKGSKKIARTRPNGEPYEFSEGAIPFPDPLDKPARTMLTSESTTNRSTHVIVDYVTGRLRLLTPNECEKLNGFRKNWTNTGMPERLRYFTMGNSLVVPIITKIGKQILALDD